MMNLSSVVFFVIVFELSWGSQYTTVELDVGRNAVFTMDEAVPHIEKFWCSGEVSKNHSLESGNVLFCPTSIRGSGSLLLFEVIKTPASFTFTKNSPVSLDVAAKISVAESVTISGNKVGFVFSSSIVWRSESLCINATGKAAIVFGRDSDIEISSSVISHNSDLTFEANTNSTLTVGSNMTLSGLNVAFNLKDVVTKITTSLVICSMNNLTFDVAGELSVGSYLILGSQNMDRFLLALHDNITINVGSSERKGDFVISARKRIKILHDNYDAMSVINVQGSMILSAPAIYIKDIDRICVTGTLKMVSNEIIILTRYKTFHVGKLEFIGDKSYMDDPRIIVMKKPKCGNEKMKVKNHIPNPLLKCIDGRAEFVDAQRTKSSTKTKSSNHKFHHDMLAELFMIMYSIEIFR